MLTGGDRWLPTRECVEPRCDWRGRGEYMFARSALLLLVLMADVFLKGLWMLLGECGVPVTE